MEDIVPALVVWILMAISVAFVLRLIFWFLFLEVNFLVKSFLIEFPWEILMLIMEVLILILMLIFFYKILLEISHLIFFFDFFQGILNMQLLKALKNISLSLRSTSALFWTLFFIFFMLVFRGLKLLTNSLIFLRFVVEHHSPYQS